MRRSLCDAWKIRRPGMLGANGGEGMRRGRWLLAGMATVLISAILLKPPATVETVTVQRGDVHQVLRLAGYMAYAEEAYICADRPGEVARICVLEGQRISPGQALLRFDATRLAYAGAHAEVAKSAIRADQACTVRQVLVCEGESVASGTPVLRVSSHAQVIRCTVPLEDAASLPVDAWGWVVSGGERIGIAVLAALAGGLKETDEVRVAFRPEKPFALKEGSPVAVEVFLAGSDGVLTLPAEAITPRNTVWCVSDGRCREIPAEVVLSDGERAWVRLPEGMRVALGEHKEGRKIRAAAP